MDRFKRLILMVLAFSLWLPAEVIEKQFEVKPGSKLYVDLEVGGDLVVTGWQKNVAQITISKRGSDCSELDLRIEKISGDIHIEAESNYRDWDSDCQLDFEIMLPDHFDLDLETRGGDFNITNITGTMEGKTMGGDLDLIRLTGSLHFVTMGGEIDLRNSEVDGLVKTMGGNVTIRDVVGDVKGKTMGGNVYYKNVTSKDGGQLETSTMGGNIAIHSENQSIKARTMGGDINVSGKEVNVSTMGGDIDVQEAPQGADVHTMGGDIFIKSAGNFVKAKTMGGDIEVEAVNGWVKATTMGGDIDITMVGDPKAGDRQVDLTSFGGGVTLTVPRGLDMEFEIELAYTKQSRRNYKIVSDFDLKIRESEEWERSFLVGEPRKIIYGSGKTGNGSNLIKIKTTNGNIYLKKAAG